MMESEAEENIELDEFEAFKFRACSPRLACKQLERLDSEEELDSGTSLPNFSPRKHDGGQEDGDQASQGGEKDTLLKRPVPKVPSPNILKFDRLGSGHISPRPDNFRLGRSLSCRPRSIPKRVEGVSPMRGRDRIHSLVGELNAISRHGSLTGTTTPNVVFEDGVEIYRVRSFTMTSKGIINRGDSFKIRSPACRRSLIKHRQDSRATLVLSQNFALSSTEGDMLSRADTEETGLPLEAEEDILEEEGDDLETIPTIYKVLLSGTSGVGKTALRQQFMTSEYLGNVDNLPGNMRKVVVLCYRRIKCTKLTLYSTSHKGLMCLILVVSSNHFQKYLRKLSFS